MDGYRKDEITYSEDWQRFDEPAQPYDMPVESKQYIENSEPETKREKKPEKKRSFPALITIQLVICLIIAFLVFILKAMNSDTYKQLCDWYNDSMKNTLVSNSSFEDIDLSHYFDASADQATADEV